MGDELDTAALSELPEPSPAAGVARSTGRSIESLDRVTSIRGMRTDVWRHRSECVNAADIELSVETEAARVTCWRATELIRAGFDPLAAVELAEHAEVDLHRALELVERGCPPTLATKILL
jgi:hypothetical protein